MLHAVIEVIWSLALWPVATAVKHTIADLFGRNP
jgi:hypothetical protein